MSRRRVHYVAAGRGLRFTCFENEWRCHGGGQPSKHTDLSKVTCQECWEEILTMAQERVVPGHSTVPHSEDQ